MSGAKCEYCGCQAVDCLARCVKTGLYFCNGKGDTSTSHIVHYLRSNALTQFTVPDSNSWAQVDLKCYVCESRNVYNLGFLPSEDGQLYLVCRTPCQYDASMIERNVNNEAFRPIISNGEILNDMVRVPKPDEYEKVTMERVHAVNTAILEKLGEKAEKAAEDGGLSHAKLRYESREEFCDIMEAFVNAEKGANEALEKRNVFRVSNLKWNGRHASFRAPIALHRSVSLGSSLRFVQGSTTVEGIVTNKSRSGVVLDVKFKDDALSGATGEIEVVVVFNATPFGRQLAALKTFRNSGEGRRGLNDFFVDILLGNTRFKDPGFKEANTCKRLKIYEPPRQYFEPFNASQVRAMETALSSRFTMIQGPPGTGKTTVIATLAYSLVCAGVRPVVVCTQSNVAADFATKRIAQTGVNVCRLLSMTREQVASDIEELTTKSMAKARFGDVDGPEGCKLEMQIINESDVICTTCVSAGGARLKGTRIRAVLFDETGQIVDPDMLIPLVRGTERIILVGDHKQLGPVILSRECMKARYDLPLMQRLIVLGLKPNVLLMQYRMHPALAKFPSMAFYDNLLKNGISEQYRTWDLPHLRWPKPGIPMFFWNVPSEEEYYENGISFVNRHEAGCIAVLLDALWRSGVKASDIGIITPYAGQQAHLMDSLPVMCAIQDPDFFKDLEVASVDAFQGREKNFILLSNVRANMNGDIGFLKDQRRVCVSLTRARYGLIIIGCADTFAQNPLWCKLIQHCQDVGVFVEGTLNDLRTSEFTPRLEKAQAKDDDLDDAFV